MGREQKGWHSSITCSDDLPWIPTAKTADTDAFLRAFTFSHLFLKFKGPPALSMEQDKEGSLTGAALTWLLSSCNSSTHLSTKHVIFKPLHGLGPGLIPYSMGAYLEPILQLSRWSTALTSLQFLLPEVLSPFSFVFPTYVYPSKFGSRSTPIIKFAYHYPKLCNPFQYPQFTNMSLH